MDANAISEETLPAEAVGDELPRGTKLLQGQYSVTRYLNAGGFGITYLARDSLDRPVVIKECFPSSMCCRRKRSVRVRSESHQKDFESLVKFFGQEARALAKLKHPNIVGVHQVFEDNHTAYMALDFVKGNDLLEIIEEEPGRLGPAEIQRILIRLLSAVSYIHDRGLLHRDISPDNILLDDHNNPVLIDFGAAREEASRVSRLLTQQATVKDGYSPQEFYISGAKQTPASDLYALAASFYHLIAGEAPPVSQLRLSAVAEGGRDPYVPLLDSTQDYDKFFLGAIDKCLSVFPKDRILSAQEWQVEIDTERRRMAARERAEDDHVMQTAIQKLVTETNKAVEAGIDAGTPVKIQRNSGRTLETPQEKRWKRFQELNVAEPETEARPEGDEEDTDAVAAQEADLSESSGKNGVNVQNTDTADEESKSDVIVKRRIRKRTLFGRVLGGVLGRDDGNEAERAEIVER